MNFRLAVLTLLLVGFLIPTANGQIVNFEETWQEFLKESKTSNISNLPQPAKEESKNYVKYNLMYANSRFCEGNIAKAKELMRNIQQTGATVYETIPGFKARHDDLEAKIQAAVEADGIWKNFLLNGSVTEEELDDVPLAIRVCEKGTLAKFSYMQAHTYYCQGKTDKARERFENYTLKIVDKTSLKIEDVKGLGPKVEEMRQVFKALKILDKSWAAYIKTDISEGFEEELPEIDCYPIPSMKAYMLIAAQDVCKNGARMLKKIQALQEINTHDVPTELAEKITWLESEVANYTGDLSTLNKIWKQFVPNDNLDELIDFDLIYCEKEAQIRSYIMNGTINVCTLGKEMLGKIAGIQAEYNPDLTKVTLEKLENLKKTVNKIDDNKKILDKSWAEFLEKDTLLSIDFGYEYCDKADIIKAYTMNGLVNICSEGVAMVEKIEEIESSFEPELSAELSKRVEKLKEFAPKYVAEASTFRKLWKSYIADGDTLLEKYALAYFYCDPIQQVQSYIIKGHFETCVNGQPWLDAIDAYMTKHNVKLDKETDCALTRLRIKVWDCRWWELVLQAREKTNEERERFGPLSAGWMYGDLNGPDLPCETTVSYYPLGNIGVKYNITVFLCQNIDLAKMGDPEYYQKISTWVDTKVLQEYCESNMRCKEDFFVYIEGHTDGNPFRGASYKRSLDIPAGTPFRHLTNEEVHNKTTEREIKNRLQNNMELGIARAWTVKQQLDFMEVPISIGAYEHSKTEKGGEYRRISIELNMTNLLLDYYEKLLNELWVASEIGDRPKTCQ